MESESSHPPPLPDDLRNFTKWSWRKRATLVEPLVEHLEQDPAAEGMRSALVALSDDPKWEVRRAVADKLGGVEDDLLIPLLAKLLNDPNQDVQSSAARVQREIRKGRAGPAGEGSDADSVENLYAQLEKKIGKRAAALARETAARQIELIIGPVVHDIKNAMQPIMGAANDILIPPTNRPIDIKQETERIRDHAQRAHRMLKALLNYAQPMKLRLREEVLADLVLHSTHSSALVFESTERRVRFRTTIDEGLKAQVDRDGICGALDNLLKNAAESFGHPRCQQPDPVVNVSLDEDPAGGFVRIIVEDNGAGIEPEELEFLRKFRPGTRSDKPGSTGFGLANAARIIRAHAGTIRIDSVPNEGTVVTVLLPISDKD